jgi:hypothetical protein
MSIRTYRTERAGGAHSSVPACMRRDFYSVSRKREDMDRRCRSARRRSHCVVDIGHRSYQSILPCQVYMPWNHQYSGADRQTLACDWRCLHSAAHTCNTLPTKLSDATHVPSISSSPSSSSSSPSSPSVSSHCSSSSPVSGPSVSPMPFKSSSACSFRRSSSYSNAA